MSTSEYAEKFVLKGGMLLAAFGSRRPTGDADALALGIASDAETVAAIVAEIANLPDPNDGVIFLTRTMRTVAIREAALYSGVRVVMDARISDARVKFKVDVNFGDPISPKPQLTELPALRTDSEPVHLLGYPMETVLAEKITTAISLGAANSRVRDFADIYTLITRNDYGWAEISDAFHATAAFRATELRTLSQAVIGLVALRERTYSTYRQSLGTDGQYLPEALDEVVAVAIAFADPIVRGLPRFTRWEAKGRTWR
jgi:hypothetical protein